MEPFNSAYLGLEAGGLSLLLIILIFWAYRRRRHRDRPIKQPPRADIAEQRRRLEVDVDSSLLTMPPPTQGDRSYYLVVDTETYELVSADEESQVVQQHAKPVAVSWQVLDDKGNLIKEASYILSPQDGVANMSEEAIRIHGITNSMLLEGADGDVVYGALSEVLPGCQALVAHNLPFHREVLLSDLCQRGWETLAGSLKALPEQICTMAWGRQLGCKVGYRGEWLYPRLDELFGYLYFGRLHLPLCYRSKTLRDVRLVSACLRVLLRCSGGGVAPKAKR